MRPVVLGTAGHIDHGKTALVRRLTGIDTDRLKEERERGISIDLGFAHLTLPSQRRVAIVDVPGHERFVKNMLAGATGIDLVLLVVAADEGVMPQTLEHFAIVNLLGIDRGVVALTKSDLASAGMVDLAAEEVRALLRGTPLANAPILPVSSTTGEGIDALIAELDRVVALVPDRDERGPARLPVDRVFSVEGIGTVVTGTLWSGAVRAGDSLALLPAGHVVRVRQVEVHDQPVPTAVAGNRTAIAVHGVAREDLSRGDWLVTPGRFRETEIADVRVHLLPTVGKPLANRARVRLHLGASEVLGRVVLYELEALPPGGAALAQIRFEGPIVAAPGDRLVIRSYSPSTTIGGATLLDPSPPKRARLDPNASRFLGVLETGTLSERVEAVVREAGAHGIPPGEAAVRLGVDPNVLGESASSAGLRRTKEGNLLSKEAWTAALDRIEKAVREYGETHRLRQGIPKGELKSLLSREVEGSVFDEALEMKLREKGLVAREDRIGLPEMGPALTAAHERALETLEGRLQGSGFQVPDLPVLLRDVPADLKPAELVRYLVESGRAVKVTSDLLYTTVQWAEIESRVRSHFAKNPTMAMAEFKDLLQVSRKYAVPLLERLDRTGLTRREGDLRLPGPRAKNLPA
jgi:selenocysteine-specific elongation factor